MPKRLRALKFVSVNRRTCSLSNAVENVQHPNFSVAFFAAEPPEDITQRTRRVTKALVNFVTFMRDPLKDGVFSLVNLPRRERSL